MWVSYKFVLWPFNIYLRRNFFCHISISRAISSHRVLYFILYKSFKQINQTLQCPGCWTFSWREIWNFSYLGFWKMSRKISLVETWKCIMIDGLPFFFSFSLILPSITIMCLGNVAWAHLCTKNKLKIEPKSISGLPIFITDDTPVTDAVRFTQRVNMDMEVFKIRPTSWSIPFLLCYMLALLTELVLKVVNLFTKLHVKYCPRGVLAFASSLILYDRLRSAISLEYEPIYSVGEGFARSAKWYDLWYQNFRNRKLSLEAKSTWIDQRCVGDFSLNG